MRSNKRQKQYGRDANRHVVLGLDLAHRRTSLILFLSLAFISSAVLTARYKYGVQDETVYGGLSNIGKQAYQVAFKAPELGEQDKTAEKQQLETEYGTNGYGADWDYQSDSAIVVDEEWSPFELDRAPITQITVSYCVIPPKLYDWCAPKSTKREDALYGKWIKLKKDLNTKAGGLFYVYIYYRRLLPHSALPVVTTIALGPKDLATQPAPNSLWFIDEKPISLRTGLWPKMDQDLFIHFRTTDQSHLEEVEDRPITNVDVVFGGSEVRPLPGYSLLEGWISGGEDDASRVTLAEPTRGRLGTRLAIARGPVDIAKANPLQFTNTGTFKIMQIADLHFSVSPGSCRDMPADQLEVCHAVGADMYTLQWLRSAIEMQNPQLVVFTGDQLNNEKTAWAPQSIYSKFAHIFQELAIPWTVIFGNHDNGVVGPGGSLDREQGLKEQMELLQHLPYFIGEPGPETVDGIGNYVRGIRSGQGLNESLFTLYFLDSHASASSLLPFRKPQYDWLKASQINWFRSMSSRIQPMERPYTPITTGRKGGHKGGSQDHKRFKIRSKKEKRQEDDFGTEIIDDDGSQVHDMDEDNPATFENGQDQGAEEDPATFENDEQGTEADNSDIFDDGSEEINTANSQVGDELYEGDDTTDGNLGEGREGKGDNMSENDVEDDTSQSEELINPVIDAFVPNADSLNHIRPQGPSKAIPMRAKPNAIAFFHIPLPEAYSPVDVTNSDLNQPENITVVSFDHIPLIVGHRYEGSGAPVTNSNFFKNAILAQGELVRDIEDSGAPVNEFWEGEFTRPTAGRSEVKIMVNGHCHISNDCRRVSGVWSCFGGGSSFAGYGSIGKGAIPAVPRGVRMFDISEWGETVETYRILYSGRVVDKVVLVGENAWGSDS